MSRRRTHALEPIGRVIQRSDLRVPKTIETSPVSPRAWEAAVGSRIAARTRPVRIDRGVLLVRTQSSVWAQELSLLSTEILFELGRRGVVAKALRFTVGAVEAPARPATHEEPRRAPPEVVLPEAVAQVVAQVEDAELRETIRRAAARSLGFFEPAGPAQPTRPTRPTRPAAPAPPRKR